MRLICPNCGAQYEIDAALLPEAGRDVQCSACGHTWFQRPETLDDELADELGATAIEPEEDIAPPPTAAPEPSRPEVRRPRRPDDSALAILREEAEREAEARRREAAGMETQGDLGLDEGPRPRRAPTAETAALAAAAAASAAPEPEPGQPEPRRRARDESRRDVFPDIEEINSSLNAAEGKIDTPLATEEAAAARKSRRRGFRVGFLTVLVFVTLLIVLYAYAPRLADVFPGARPFLADYVDWANHKRDQIDGLMQSAIALIGG